jgi:adenylate cyclase
VAVSGSGASGRLDQAVGTFILQEFASPVSGIIGFVDILVEDARRDGLDDFIPDLEKMRAAAVQLLSLIERIVDGTAVDVPDGLGIEADRSKLRHDLRTPLNAIKGYGELLAEEAQDGGNQVFLRDLGAVLEHANRLLADIDRLVNFGEGPSGPATTSTPSIDIVRDVLRTIAPIGDSDAPARLIQPSRILAVDDNAANRDLLSRRLARDGHYVTTADDGAAALALAADNSFDLVLLDLMMPGLSGFEVLCRLKADERTREIPVIMISALDELDSTVRCIEAGAEDYLPKPFNPVLLRARINACLEKKRLHDRERTIAEELRAEKERSEALLLNILPRTIIERLRQGETVIADRVAEATILFADLVDFTALVAHSPPERTVELLGGLFAKFDALAARLGLEKIKTTGDGYMVAGGLPLPHPRPDHVAAMAEMALAMCETAASSAADFGENLQLRIGVHSGDLIAGVIGTHKFVYDVWGDTVNTAKRMESYGMPGRIHVSAAIRQLLGESFRFEPREPISVKGKGVMATYFLDRKS